MRWGVSTDKPTPADFDGDGKTDIAVWRDGQNWIKSSLNGPVTSFQFGVAGDIPAAAALGGSL